MTILNIAQALYLYLVYVCKPVNNNTEQPEANTLSQWAHKAKSQWPRRWAGHIVATIRGNVLILLFDFDCPSLFYAALEMEIIKNTATLIKKQAKFWCCVHTTQTSNKTIIVCIHPTRRIQCIFPRSQNTCLYIYILTKGEFTSNCIRPAVGSNIVQITRSTFLVNVSFLNCRR